MENSKENGLEFVLRIAKGLTQDGSHAEYRRGIVELIAEMYPLHGIPHDERSDQIQKLLLLASPHC